MPYKYLVYRVGSNAANQPMTFEPVPIAIVEAKNRRAAVRRGYSGGGGPKSVHDCLFLDPDGEIVAQVGDLSVYANQYLYALPRSKASKRDWNAVLEENAMRSQVEGEAY